MPASDASREFLRSDLWGKWETMETAQRRRLPPPPPEKPAAEGAPLLDLVPPDRLTLGRMPVREAIARRHSRRRYLEQPLSLEELSFLLWATQGLRGASGHAFARTVPSAGARHPFETYLAILRVDGIEPGLYRYLPLRHKLCHLRSDPDLASKLANGCQGQSFVAESAVTFIWAAIPYRMEWRYAAISPKLIALDAGHVCQNLYLACEAIGAGTCAVGAYYQDQIDDLVGVDGVDEFTVYLAPVGKV
jgi:SagB-type dehydrogenase family enzyme